MTPSPFSPARIDLQGARLVGLEPASAIRLAAAVVAVPPWSAMNYPADALARFLAASDDGASRYLVEVDGAEAGAVSVRYPWLKGPYLELLALLPPFQGRGIGAGIMSWFEEAGRSVGARNLWVCASSFNDGALRFYQRHGF
jgi:GNAT superfamily N-acetyltransferase